MSATAEEALQTFDATVSKAGDFTPRPGQRKMAELVARTTASGTLGDSKEPERAIAVIQAGTGVGKSLAASVPAIVAALKRQSRVIISTATVALQEQLINKDLPRFAALMDQPFTFALAKGRGRYVCKLKLQRLAGGHGEADHDLFGDGIDDEPNAKTANKSSAPATESTVVLYKELMDDLAKGRWDGEKDTLAIGEGAVDWAPIAADRRSCTGRHCSMRGQCTYFEARKKLASANVIVANHDLLLASLDAKLLPAIEDSLLVLDEAHELAAVASGQFSRSMELSSARWLDQLVTRLGKVGAAVGYTATPEAARLAQSLKQAQADLLALVMDLYGSYVNSKDKTARLKHGRLPDPLVEPMGFVHAAGKGLCAHMNAISEALREKLQEQPDNTLASMYTALGVLAPRLEELVDCAGMMLADNDKPDAKWFAFGDEAGYVRVTANASPLVAGDLLVQDFWPRVRSAVLTSATLTSCGSFDFFLEEVGLQGNPAVTTLEVESPFDYPAQGQLVVIRTKASPRQIEAYNAEVAGEMLADMAQVQTGALALFTSKAHMRQTFDAMPESLRERVLLQGAMSRAALLREHRQRVDAGGASIIMGLQSFGQGIDLPGAYCETLFIAKMPFVPPTDPIGEARAEWLSTQGRDAFAELSVPAAGVKLAQWMGRLIRTEQDLGKVVCYDKRLVETAYGKRILRGMPPFQLLERAA